MRQVRAQARIEQHVSDLLREELGEQEQAGYESRLPVLLAGSVDFGVSFQS